MSQIRNFINDIMTPKWGFDCLNEMKKHLSELIVYCFFLLFRVNDITSESVDKATIIIIVVFEQNMNEI